ncbi:hypothetical protein GCM10023085_59120 [Actinomadura viridis]|uniref:Uncharacterized protein n=1 Tax=Actinomadura viridis TaxID=58110 RepID=A0A931DR89_9ACTN|nr:hypothetical protein [Actinomadura viridis]MBG6093294.1 hypothetical protein [Actinomadura viridis]
MTDKASGPAMARFVQADRVYVGWRYAQMHPDPGPPPGRPEPPEPAQAPPLERRPGEYLAGRPLRIAAAGGGVGMALFLLCGLVGVLPWAFAAVAMVACAIVLGITGYALWQDELAVRARLAQERTRSERLRAAWQRERDAAETAYLAAYRDWESRQRAYAGQREWYPVAVPPDVDRVDVVGGTLAGWSAAVTTMGAARLAAGARLTVIDLSEGAVAHDLLRLAAARGDDPLVWVLPADLPRLDATRGLGREALADVLSLVVSAGEEQSGTRDLSFDNSILERIIEVLGEGATIPRITAALRVLAQVGDPRDDLRKGLLTDAQLERITTLFGRGAADRIVVRRAWALEAQLRKLERLAAEPVRLPPSRLHVVSMDRRAGVLTNRVLGTYVTTALTHRIREAPPGGRWDHTLFLCGAEKLRGDVLDRLIDACEAAGTGLVLLYRSIPPHVRERLGRRGHAAVGFMRLGNPEDARIAAEHIGADQPLLVAEITDAAGVSLADVAGESYASTVAYARSRGDELTEPVWSPLPAPAADDSTLVEGISSATDWGRSLAATEDRRRDEGGELKQRFRELLVEPPQLQELPATAMVFTHAGATGRRVLLVDANPGIITLPTAHSMEFEEYLRLQKQGGERANGTAGGSGAGGAVNGTPPPGGTVTARIGDGDPNGDPSGDPSGDANGDGDGDGERDANADGDASGDGEEGVSGDDVRGNGGRDAGDASGEARPLPAPTGQRSAGFPWTSRARHALPRGAGPRGPGGRGTRRVPPMKPNGKHAADPPP